MFLEIGISRHFLGCLEQPEIWDICQVCKLRNEDFKMISKFQEEIYDFKLCIWNNA